MSKILKRSILLLIIALGILVLGGTAVNAATMSDEFKSHLNKDGKFVFNSNIPANDDHFALLVDLNTYDEEFNWNGLSFSNISEDYSECDLTINSDDDNKKETHRVKIHYNYDEKADTKIKNFVNTVIKNKTVFEVSDLELVNYYYNRIKNGYKAELTMFSGELKEALDYGNLEFEVSVRGGSSAPLQRETIGFGYFSYAGSIYHVINPFGTTADHIIYVPNETENTEEAIIAAAQKRIDDYLGDTDVEVSYLSTAWEYWVKYHYEDTREMWEEYEGLGFTIEQFEQLIGAYVFQYPSFEEGFEEIFGLSGISEDDWMFTIDVPIDENMGDSFDVFIKRDSSKMVNPISKTADLTTDIEISTNETIPLDTIIQAKELTEGTEYEKIIKLLNVTDNKTFDLKLYSSSLNDYITKLDDGTFEVRIPIPEDFEGKDLIVYYVDGNNKVHEHTVTLEGNYAVYKTDHFSIYTLAVEGGTETDTDENTNKGDKDKTPATGVESAISYVLVATIISGAGIVILKKKIQ